MVNIYSNLAAITRQRAFVRFERGPLLNPYLVKSPRVAGKRWSTLIRNPELPPDCVELASFEKPVASHYYRNPPDHKPSDVPSDFVLVKVYQSVKFIGWTYMSEKEVASLL
jgi:hypothetical protein